TQRGALHASGAGPQGATAAVRDLALRGPARAGGDPEARLVRASAAALSPRAVRGGRGAAGPGGLRITPRSDADERGCRPDDGAHHAARTRPPPADALSEFVVGVRRAPR